MNDRVDWMDGSDARMSWNVTQIRSFKYIIHPHLYFYLT